MPKEKVKINVKERIDDNVLDLSLSEIEIVPVRDIAALRRMTVLDLSSNNIKFLPKNFGALLPHLTRLDLGKNQLKFLSEDFCNLVNLKHLDLYNNQLENLPVNFGKLSKLRFLDLKGNPLQPTLQKITGPCLTTKDCLDAAKQIIPFMIDLEVKFTAEQAKKEEAEKQIQEEEAKKARDEAWIAKKAARKERVTRERQEKAEAEKVLGNNVFTTSDSNNDASQPKAQHSTPKSSNILSLIKICIFVVFVFNVVLAMLYKFLPNQSNVILSMLPDQQQVLLRSFFNAVNANFLKIFDKFS